jgi:N-acetylglucosamine repressor
MSGGRPPAAARERILGFVREKRRVSRGEIARAFSMDKKAVSVAVDRLLSEGILAVAGLQESRAGRRREILAVNGAHAAAVGIDLGATHVIGVLADLAGVVLDRASYEVRPGLPVALILDQMRTMATRLCSSPRGLGAKAIGVCVPGFVHPVEGTSLVAENIPGWKDVRVREALQEGFGLPVSVEDASRALAACERWLGKARGEQDFIALDLGFGIGMGIFCGGVAFRGSGWKSGEIGHTVVDPLGLPCACGGRGCLETVASGRAIARRAAEGIRDGRSALLAQLTKGSAAAVTAQDVGVAAGMGDRFSTELLASAGRAVGLALANAAAILNPSLVVLGGGLLGAGRVFLDAIRESADRHLMPGMRPDLRIEVSELGLDGSARGAALIASEAIFSGTTASAAASGGLAAPGPGRS